MTTNQSNPNQQNLDDQEPGQQASPPPDDSNPEGEGAISNEPDLPEDDSADDDLEDTGTADAPK
jgi:hypothetical protein